MSGKIFNSLGKKVTFLLEVNFIKKRELKKKKFCASRE